MSREHVDHTHIVRFADERVNLKREDAAEYRAQVNRLRDRVDSYLSEHPDFELRKMMLSGSLAKGTALKSLNDADVACYVSAESSPEGLGNLLEWLAERLRKAFSGIKPEQVKVNKFSVTMSFVGTGLRVDVVPILYTGDKVWRGYLVSQDTGEKLLTSIPMHLDFIRKRKQANDKNFAQVVRLVKFWTKIRKQEDDNFRFKSFMVELIVAHLADEGLDLSDYPTALAKIFAHIAVDGFRSPIAFSDYYSPSSCATANAPIRIWDPVNHENNVAKLYTSTQADGLVEAALDAGDAIDSALRSPTKGETLRYWRKIFGSTFDA